MDDAVELSDVIGQLRNELSRAMWAGENSDLRFEAETVELELTVAVERSRDPGGKVRFWVVEAGTTARRQNVTTQRIKLLLRPRTVAEPDRPARIGGRPVPGER
jgi:hypothetical protein